MTDTDSPSVERATKSAAVQPIAPAAELSKARQRIVELEADVAVTFRLAIDLREAHGRIADLELAALQHSKTENELRYTRQRVGRLIRDLADSESELRQAERRLSDLATRPASPGLAPRPAPSRRRAATSTLKLMKRAPARSRRDDLQLLKGVGPAMASKLNANGIYTFAQMGALDQAGILELQELIPELGGRAQKHNWAEQAKRLHAER